MLHARQFLTALAGVLLLSACGSGKEDAGDPALSGELGDQILVDPDIAGEGGAKRREAGLPPELRSPEAIAVAMAEAARLAGGAIQPAPSPAAAGNELSQAAIAETSARIAGQAPGMGIDCPRKVEYSAAWADRLPAALAVYPRGHVIEAAGTDRDGCRFRVVNFITPVAVSDVIAFYHARVRAAGYDAEHLLDGRDNVLGGVRDAAAYVIYARKLGNGLTEVDIIANGG